LIISRSYNSAISEIMRLCIEKVDDLNVLADAEPRKIPLETTGVSNHATEKAAGDRSRAS